MGIKSRLFVALCLAMATYILGIFLFGSAALLLMGETAAPLTAFLLALLVIIAPGLASGLWLLTHFNGGFSVWIRILSFMIQLGYMIAFTELLNLIIRKIIRKRLQPARTSL